jgi:hypothetical protein
MILNGGANPLGLVEETPDLLAILAKVQFRFIARGIDGFDDERSEVDYICR